MKVAAVRLTAGEVHAGDRFLITGPTTGAVEGAITMLRRNDSAADYASKGSEITFPVSATVRENDLFYIRVKKENGK